jgi:hypothetical protein
VPLADNGSTALAFKTSAANQKIIIRYNAECQGGSVGWVSVSIFVDGVQASPASGSDFALCTGTGYSGALRQSIYVVPASGAHSATVQAQGGGGNTSCRSTTRRSPSRSSRGPRSVRRARSDPRRTDRHPGR